jgi:CHASE3 domain sensor protein
MTDVKRYEPRTNCQAGTADVCEDGDYVKFSDYQALQVDNERLKNALNNTAAALSERVDTRKLKADAVREAIESAVSVWSGDIGDNVVLVDSLIEYTNKLEGSER